VREPFLDRSSGPRKVASPLPPHLLRPEFEIAGTWDFKWPMRTEIRIAFQRLPDGLRIPVSGEDFEAAKESIRGVARLWEPLPGLRLRFLEDDLDPPLEAAGSDIDRQRSSFDPKDPKDIPYDVLISLEDLPVIKIDPFRGSQLAREEILLPISALGSYARRADYGAPTMYLGRFGSFLSDTSFAEYFRQDLAQHVIVHEFGHMLGLPHLHQHPDLIVPIELSKDSVKERITQLDRERSAFYKPIAEVRNLLSKLIGVDIPPDVVEDHLLRAWRGNKAFSDWVELDPRLVSSHKETGELPSVMTFPYYHLTHPKNGGCDACSTGRQTHAVLAGKFLKEPGAEDRRMLELMYAGY
jgi:hypothetical protein